MTTQKSVLTPFFLAGLTFAIGIWLTIIILLGANDAFQAPVGQPPLATLAAIVLPPALFLLLLKHPDFSARIMAIDPVWLTAVQGLRILGAVFLVAYSLGHLPGLFAHVAGWGDVLVALLAPFVVTALARDRNFLHSPWFWRFHALGLLDFAGAVGSGLLARMLLDAGYDVGSTAALSRFPLLLIPCFAVPLWICFHITVFRQIRWQQSSVEVAHETPNLR